MSWVGQNMYGIVFITANVKRSVLNPLGCTVAKTYLHHQNNRYLRLVCSICRWEQISLLAEGERLFDMHCSFQQMSFYSHLCLYLKDAIMH